MATEQVIEQVAEGLEDVAGHFEEAAVVTRTLDAKAVGFLFGGLVVGLGVGFFLGHRWNKAQLRAEAFKKSEEEVETIREVYRQKTVAAEPKPSVDEVLEKRGYSNVTMETAAVARPLRPPVPIQEPLRREDIRKEKDDGWDYELELSRRTSNQPYIIHQDEFRNSETGYTQVVYTWYDRDHVLTDEDEDPLANADEIVGMANLEKFGHGADDVRALFVRNETMNTEFEICFVDASYEETFEGLSNEQTD